jgi:SM-20-related protein
LEQAFEALINGFINDRVGLQDNFLDEALSQDLKDNLLRRSADRQMKAAGIGNNLSFRQNAGVRSDSIYWLDRNHNDKTENSFFDCMDAFVQYLNTSCYTGIMDYEFHYALYPQGSFYKRHLDQFKDNQKRAYSMIMYLNSEWNSEDGGELCIYHPDSTQIIEPIFGRCVFFKSSELEHEVLLSHKDRMSITGWLKTQ